MPKQNTASCFVATDKETPASCLVAYDSDSEVCLGKQKNQNYSTLKEKDVKGEQYLTPDSLQDFRNQDGVVLAERTDKLFNGAERRDKTINRPTNKRLIDLRQRKFTQW